MEGIEKKNSGKHNKRATEMTEGYLWGRAMIAHLRATFDNWETPLESYKIQH